jgi:YD repeat-containing protein
MLKKNVVRDGQNRVIGSVTTGYAGGSSLVRDAEGRLISTNTPDAGLLFGNDDE